MLHTHTTHTFVLLSLYGLTLTCIDLHTYIGGISNKKKSEPNLEELMMCCCFLGLVTFSSNAVCDTVHSSMQQTQLLLLTQSETRSTSDRVHINPRGLSRAQTIIPVVFKRRFHTAKFTRQLEGTVHPTI